MKHETQLLSINSIYQLKYQLTRYLIPSFEIKLVICLEDPLEGEETSQLVFHQACHTRKPGTDGPEAVKQHKLFISHYIHLAHMMEVIIS